MKGDPRIIETLNLRLSEELAAINQYMLHSAMCNNWGYLKLHKKFETRAIKEMKHAELLLDHILFLEGFPNVSKLASIIIGKAPNEMILIDIKTELGAVNNYNDSISVAISVGDNNTREIFEDLLEDEVSHLDELESERDQIIQISYQLWLSKQICDN